MAKPPPSGPSTDIENAPEHERERIAARNHASKHGSAETIEKAERESAGRPANSGKMAGSDGK